MFFGCGIWCAADVSGVSPSSVQSISTFVDQTRIQLTRQRRENSFFSKLGFQYLFICLSLCLLIFLSLSLSLSLSLLLAFFRSFVIML